MKFGTIIILIILIIVGMFVWQTYINVQPCSITCSKAGYTTTTCSNAGTSERHCDAYESGVGPASDKCQFDDVHTYSGKCVKTSDFIN